MFELIILFLAVLGLLFLVVARKARWKERAQAAEKQNRNVRKAHAIKNHLARDLKFRERVREHFKRR